MTNIFKPDKDQPVRAEDIRALLDKSIQDRRAAQPRRQYLGASMWGEECARKLAYGYHQFPVDEGRDFAPRILRIFDMGHDAEERVAEYLRIAGFELKTHKDDGKQFGFSECDGKLKGHLDGILVSGPGLDGITYPCLWENKGLNDNGWESAVKNGIRVSKPLYYSQAQTYMAYMDLSCCLFTAINRDSGDIYVEIIKPDLQNSQESSDRAVRVISSSSPEEFGRIAGESTDKRCKFCDYRRRCWNLTETIPQPTNNTPSWLTKST